MRILETMNIKCPFCNTRGSLEQIFGHLHTTHAGAVFIPKRCNTPGCKVTSETAVEQVRHAATCTPKRGVPGTGGRQTGKPTFGCST